MIKLNFLYVALSALIPILTGFVWYSNVLFGKAWMRAADISEEKLKGGNMAVILVVSLILSMLLALSLMPITIHQLGIYSILAEDQTLNDPQSPTSLYVADFMNRYGSNFRTFKHGAFHGILSALLFAMPIISINAMFERRSFKYIAIHVGYWVITLALMGGVICAFA
jgi:hypothetical protein